MQFFRQPVKINESEAADIISETLLRLSESINDEIYITASCNGVVTRSQVVKEINQLLDGDGRTSIGLICSTVDLDRSLVKDVLSNVSKARDDCCIGDGIVLTR